ncbi:MAG: MBL fold metallo-hydrolase [Novosphingobium sp.]|nr:MBL fold metallo-hydrolase [Novosphingobium sp.]
MGGPPLADCPDGRSLIVTSFKRIGLAALALVLIGAGAAYAFQARIGTWLFERGTAQRMVVDNVAALGDGLHIGLCGTGSPMPNLDRAGPCNVVIAGKQMYVVDIGEGGGETLNVMGISPGKVSGLLLTHFHSDHIDGLGPLMLFHWTRGSSTAPLPVYGPKGVEAIVAGFNAAYATDNTYRIAHHGPKVVPPSGAGGIARPFDMAGPAMTVLERDGLKITAFTVNHDPIKPAVGYRFDYKGRSLCISGDTKKSSNLEAVCTGVDILVHEALNPALVQKMEAAAAANGQAGAAKILHDIQDYHTAPWEAAESAQNARTGMLVLSHLVPPLPSRWLYAAFLGDAESRFSGQIVVGEDGMMFSLPAGSKTINRARLM